MRLTCDVRVVRDFISRERACESVRRMEREMMWEGKEGKKDGEECIGRGIRRGKEKNLGGYCQTSYNDEGVGIKRETLSTKELLNLKKDKAFRGRNDTASPLCTLHR